jgi:hypothetical protein
MTIGLRTVPSCCVVLRCDDDDGGDAADESYVICCVVVRLCCDGFCDVMDGPSQNKSEPQENAKI